ncbi:MAG: ion channel DMI1 [Alphaproteobacteria bacterium]|nr:ion channel DMI1 [Alphaproteobacteria bacterium]
MSPSTGPRAWTRPWRRAAQFRLERFLLRGALFRLGFIALVLFLVAAAGGLAAFVLAPVDGSLGDSVWWAFLRLTDPGYLGDDEGAVRRLISTFVTVCGYVMFMGALIAIMTQWLDATMRQLERGETPIVMRDHFLVLGSSERVAVLIRELMLSQARVERFLSRRKAHDLRIVVMADEVDADYRSDLRSRLGPFWDDRRVILRSGSRLRLDHLERVDFLHAAAILLPAGDEGEEESTRDAATVKALLSLVHHPQVVDSAFPPRIVAEVKDHRVLQVVRDAYRGQLDLIPGDLLVGRLLAHSLRHAGLSHVIGELLDRHRGHNLYFHELPELAGLRFHDAVVRFPTGVLMGVVRQEGRRGVPHLNPPGDFRLEADDVCVVMARSYEDARAGAVATGPAPSQDQRATVRDRLAGERRLLLCGWSSKVPDLLAELDTYGSERFRIDVVSLLGVEAREAELRDAGFAPQHIVVQHIEGDYALADVQRRLAPGDYDKVVFIGRGRSASGEVSDARSLLGYLVLDSVLPDEDRRPEVVIEVLDPSNVALFHNRSGEVLLSPALLSHVLAQVALRPEVGLVVDELFTVGGAELCFRGVEELALGPSCRFDEVQRAAWRRGEVALGVRVGGEVQLGPTRDQRLALAPGDQVVLLSTY